MKKQQVITIALAAVIVVLIVVLIRQFTVPLNFDQEKREREQVVISRIKDIRSAEQAFKSVHQRYLPTFDSLIDFILNDSIEYERRIGSFDDSLAVARGEVYTEKFMVAVIDTVFSKKYTPEMVRELQFVPFSEIAYGEPQPFYLDAGFFFTESGVEVPVFECKAPYKLFLSDLDRQLLINLIDEQQNVMGRYPGIKVGAMNKATNDAGNWE